MVETQSKPLTGMNNRAQGVSELLKLLGNPQRLMIACLLCEGDYGVSEIEEALGIRQPTLSQQLGILREAGLIAGCREAKAVIYHLADERMRQLIEALHGIFCPEGVAGLQTELPVSGSRLIPSLAGAAVFARLVPRRVA